VRVAGQRDVPAQPELLGTTKDFLDHYGLADLDELPPLDELKALADLNPQLALPVGGDGEEPVLVPDTEPTGGVPSSEAPPSEAPSSEAPSSEAPSGEASQPAGDAERT